MRPHVLEDMLTEFDGCEGDDPGSPESPLIWLFGLEPGWSLADQKAPASAASSDPKYSIKTQSAWPFNRNAFKLLAAIEGRPVQEYREFAEEHQPFVKGSKGYFKGNLFPYACYKLDCWPEELTQLTGFTHKSAYQHWCQENRLPVIRQWLQKHRPRVFIGVGISFYRQFALAAHGSDTTLRLKTIRINSGTKKLYFGESDGIKLVVTPHLSRGLTGNKALQEVGRLIGEFMRN